MASRWAEQRFGSLAESLRRAVETALVEAHRDAVAAQLVSNTKRHDPYGHTLKNRQYETLVECVRRGELPGVEVIHPMGAAFELIAIRDSRTVLFPLRLGSDRRRHPEDAAIRVSQLRRELLAPADPDAGQMTIDDVDLDDEAWAERDAAAAALREYSHVVVIAFVSNPSGMTDARWGEAELPAGAKRLIWSHSEPLTLQWSNQSQTSLGDTGAAAKLDVVTDKLPAESPRWDEGAPVDDDFGLTARNPLESDSPVDEDGDQGSTGTDET